MGFRSKMTVAMDDLPPLFAPGQRLGRYELLQRLAVGGMAEVYLAYASGPGDFRKVVAIKRLLPQHALDPQLLRMFLDEARLMARLAHPHVPQVTDVDDGEVPYFVMEYVHGTDLRGILNAAGGALPIEIALSIGVAVAAGLHHAHEHRGAAGQRLEIVHRDVSPSNVLVSFDGAVKVTDFGVAKWAEQKSFTHQGQLKGKFAHMSPEQCRGEALDRRSDVFALGTLIYEMTTGAPPFVAESEYELLTQIVQRDAPPPVRPGGEYPTDLRAIVMKSLSRAREDRQASAQELQLQLEAFGREHRLVVSPVALAEYLETLFGARVSEWREALKSGQTLVDLLAKRSGHGAAGAGTEAVVPSGTAAGDRTATDVFTLGQRDDGAKASSPAGTAPRSRASTGRRIAVGVVAAVALVLLLVATELTSEWQRAARGTGAPARVESAAGETAKRAPPLPAAPEKGPEPKDAPEATLAGRETMGTAPSTATAVTHRGRDAALPGRGTRREAGAGTRRSTTTVSNAGEPGAAAERGRSASTDTDGEAATTRSPNDATTATPPPMAPRPGTPAAPPAAPVKVWDPDSPVPP